MSVISLNENDLEYVINRILKEFIDYTPNEKNIKAKEIMSTINIDGGMAILSHNSNKIIKNGSINVGMQPNTYSYNEFKSDPTPRSFFWGTEYGLDVSNNSTYRYFCSLPINEIYPLGTGADPENLRTLSGVKNAGYSAAAYYMDGDKKNGTIVVSFKNLPIKKIIKLSDSGTIFDGHWNFISTTNQKYDSASNKYVSMSWDKNRQKLV